MTFGQAIESAKGGVRIAREGWNGKDMWLTYVAAEDYAIVEPLVGSRELLPFLAMKTADNKIVPWLASQTDMLATDWVEVG